MEIDKSVLSESLTIELAAEASLAGIIDADAGGKYVETEEKDQGTLPQVCAREGRGCAGDIYTQLRG